MPTTSVVGDPTMKMRTAIPILALLLAITVLAIC